LGRKDGEIDYSKYSFQDLLGVEAVINERKYPKSYANLQREIANRKKSAPPADNSDRKLSVEDSQEDKFNWFFPDKIETPDQIKTTLKTGAFACAIVAVTTIFAASYSIYREPILDLDAWSYVDAVLFAILGYGIFRGSRVAAIIALVIFVWSRYVMYVDEGKFGGVLSILVLAMFITGVRGAFAYNKRSPSPEPSNDRREQ
jgi:hypothetical protein